MLNKLEYKHALQLGTVDYLQKIMFWVESLLSEMNKGLLIQVSNIGI